MKGLRALPPPVKRTAVARWIPWVGRWLAVWIAAGNWASVAADADPPALERYAYVETTGSQRIPITYVIERGERVEIRVQRADEHFFNRCEPSGVTLEWHYRGKAVDVQAHREGPLLVVQGHRQGKPFQDRHPIDEAPWFQPLSYALQPFLESERRSVHFWLIRTDNFEPVKMKAVRSGTEELMIGERRLASTRVDVAPAGALSFVWRGSYWFSRSSKVFLQYAGGHLLSGPSDTVVRLQPDADLPGGANEISAMGFN